jgi:hypothetical protein
MRPGLYAGNEKMMLRLSFAKIFAKPLQIQCKKWAITAESLPGWRSGHSILLHCSAGTSE